MVLFGIFVSKMGEPKSESTSTSPQLFLFFRSISEAYARDNGYDSTDMAGANETDLVFLKGLLESPAVTQLIKVSLAIPIAHVLIAFQRFTAADIIRCDLGSNRLEIIYCKCD